MMLDQKKFKLKRECTKSLVRIGKKETGNFEFYKIYKGKGKVQYKTREDGLFLPLEKISLNRNKFYQRICVIKIKLEFFCSLLL